MKVEKGPSREKIKEVADKAELENIKKLIQEGSSFVDEIKPGTDITYRQWYENFDKKLIKYIDISKKKAIDDSQICAQLGIEVGQKGEILPNTDLSKIWSLEEIQVLIEQQKDTVNNAIKMGDLKNDGDWNIFYVKYDDDLSIHPVCIFWSHFIQKWCTIDSRFGDEWSSNLRVFSRN